MMLLSSSYYNVVGFLMFLCMFLSVFVLMYMMLVSKIKTSYTMSSESEKLEFIWTFMPCLLVMLLCFLNLFYLLSSNDFGTLKNMKMVGHQWYWSYEDYKKDLDYDSYNTCLIKMVDNPLNLNYLEPVSLLITSGDVMHSFSVPDMGLKVDAMPGRMNELKVVPSRLGSFSGYCSELCGANHSYMPMLMNMIK